MSNFASNAKITETRVSEYGARVRRYVEPDGFKFQTVEIPLAALKHISVARAAPAVKRALNGIDIRRAAYKRRAEVKRLSEEGWKAAAIAHHMGLADGTVQRIKRELGI